jgi:two-component system sensor histidine kinase CreC
MNIIQNAIDFSPVGSTTDLHVVRSNSGIEFQIRDTGSGIPDYASERIFERFYSLKRPENGRKSSGLGLSLVTVIGMLKMLG